MNQQRLIALAERARNVEGSEKWAMILCADGVNLYFEHKANKEMWPDSSIVGPLLPHNPLDPMNPAACLERAGAFTATLAKTPYESVLLVVSLTFGANLIDSNEASLYYADYMEALLNLHDLAKEQGEYQLAWERAMNPEGE